MNKKGFTLIELLIVIALLGVLAIGLLATIDPFEQLKKGRDTSTRNLVQEFYNAALRYYATKNSFPWQDQGMSAAALTAADMTTYTSAIYDMGELKEGFLNATGRDRVYVTSTNCSGTGGCDDLTVCFQPQSKSFRGDNNTIFNSEGVSQVATGDPNSSEYYWCIN